MDQQLCPICHRELTCYDSYIRCTTEIFIHYIRTSHYILFSNKYGLSKYTQYILNDIIIRAYDDRTEIYMDLYFGEPNLILSIKTTDENFESILFKINKFKNFI